MLQILSFPFAFRPKTAVQKADFWISVQNFFLDPHAAEIFCRFSWPYALFEVKVIRWLESKFATKTRI